MIADAVRHVKAGWSNAHMVPRSRRVFTLHVAAYIIGVCFYVHNIPFGRRDPLELLQQWSLDGDDGDGGSRVLAGGEDD